MTTEKCLLMVTQKNCAQDIITSVYTVTKTQRGMTNIIIWYEIHKEIKMTQLFPTKHILDKYCYLNLIRCLQDPRSCVYVIVTYTPHA